MKKYKVTKRNPEPDANGRKETDRKYVKAKSELDAAMEVSEWHPGWQLLKVEEV